MIMRIIFLSRIHEKLHGHPVEVHHEEGHHRQERNGKPNDQVLSDGESHGEEQEQDGDDEHPAYDLIDFGIGEVDPVKSWLVQVNGSLQRGFLLD